MTAARYRPHTQHADRREFVQRLLALAEHLHPADRLLVEHVYSHGRPISELARITGKPARTLQSRLAKLLTRMTSTEFLFLVQCGHELDARTLAAARRVVCQGLTYRGAARQLRISLHAVRGRMGCFRDALHTRLLAQRKLPVNLARTFNEHLTEAPAPC